MDGGRVVGPETVATALELGEGNLAAIAKQIDELEGLTFHGNRHGFSRLLLVGGVDVKIAWPADGALVHPVKGDLPL
jgi:hypothetical protein